MLSFLNKKDQLPLDIYSIELIEPTEAELGMWGSLAYIEKAKRDRLHEAGFGVMQEAVKIVNKLLKEKEKKKSKEYYL